MIGSILKKKYTLTAKIYDKAGRLLSTGVNDYKKSHPIQAYFAKKVGQPNRIYLHAEIAALLKAKNKKAYRIHIERTNQKLAKPCPICMEAIKAWGIKVITYSQVM